MHVQAQRRSFLFLQGPPGPFFPRLGAALAARRHRVFRINFNGGDRMTWPGDATDYRGSAGDWPRFFDAFVRRHDVTDLVLFGDCRPLHRAAHGLATLHGLRIHVFEEGYIRPDWVTLEADGVNGNSTLSRDPDWYLAAARLLPPVPAHPPIPSSFNRRAREAAAYYTSTVLQCWRFPGYRSHRKPAAALEGLGWVRRYAARKRAAAHTARVLAALEKRKYFVFPLQLDTDVQVSVHSPFGNVRTALSYIIESFARAAPADSLLIVKLHPLDNGLINFKRATASAARQFGVEHRVLFLDGGDIAKIVQDARGVVTINSTTGTLSVGVGVPTVVLGHAVYDIPGITHQGSLDGFWSEPMHPDGDIWDGFCRVLVDRCLVRGGFLSDEGLDLLIAGSIARLTSSVAYSSATVATQR